MDMTTEILIMLAYALAAICIFLLGKWLLKPGKLLLKLLGNSLVGLVVLLLINAVGASFGLHIPLNAISILLAGLLGAPGVLLLLLQALSLFPFL